MDNIRERAMRVLEAVHEQDAYANVVLAKELRRAELSDMDRRFLTELVYGAVKAGETLDWILRQYINRPIQKIPPKVREILRLGIYQLFYMDRIPASAVCNEAVELTKKYAHSGTVKFVNAVLRTAAREPERAKFPEGKGKAIDHLALSAQHPRWLVKRWVKAFGYAEAEELCKIDNEQPILVLRTNTQKISRAELMEKLRMEGLSVEPSTWTDEGILCLEHGALDSLESLKRGLFQVQDESSMQVAHVLSPEPEEFILDVCSAPGGKTTHIAELMQNKGRIIAGDLYEHKNRRVAENSERLGLSIIETILMDARTVGEKFPEQADRVLVDAPCSGLGVLRRKPDARWKKTQEGLAVFPPLQTAILESAAHAVKVGGILVYSTCTLEQAENRDVVENFLHAHPEFELEDTGAFLPVKKRAEKMVQLYPQRDGTDGFFIARMKKIK